MVNIAFNPWVGPHYKSEGLGGVKLLILGESQYWDDPNITEPLLPHPSDAKETEKNVNDLAINGPKRHRPFWTKVTKLLLNRVSGERITPQERADLWNRVAFYNYIQWWMPRGRTNPTPQMWKEAREPFLDVIRIHSPDIVLVLGSRMQAHLPPISPTVLCIPHPASRGFTYAAPCAKIRIGLDCARATATRETSV